MRYFSVAIFAFSLSGCATLQNFNTKAATYACEHKDEIIASAIAMQDYAAVKAITDYCANRGL